MKKTLVRIVGALCILTAVATVFLAPWVNIDDIDRKELRAVRSDVDEILEFTEDDLLEQLGIEKNNIRYINIKDDLRDNDLPYSKGKLRDWFSQVRGLAKEALDDTVSLNELLRLSLTAPELIKDINNLLDTEYCAESVFYSVADYRVAYPRVDEDVSRLAEEILVMTENTVDVVSEISFVFPVFSVGIILILVLAIAAAITHVCDRGRWLKFVLIVVFAALIVGSYFSLVELTNVLQDYLLGIPMLEDMELNITSVPFFVLVMLLVPFILDLIFERKST